MAFSASTEWDVRTTGSDSNGGGFNTSSSGTDYSQQDNPQVTYSDLVIDATTNTKCTSAAHPFTSAHVGNIINITGGTGFTVQRVQIVSVTSNVATVDKSLGTLSSTGGIGNLGGGLLTIGTANGLLVSGNTIHIKAGTYTLTAVVQLPGFTAVAAVTLMGYNATHYDYGTPPLITTATNSTILFRTGLGVGSNSGCGFNFINLSLSNTASTRADGVDAVNGNAPAYFYRCTFDGFVAAIDAPGGSAWDPVIVVDECEIKNCSSYGVRTRAGGLGNMVLRHCYIHNNSGAGAVQAGGGTLFVMGCIFANNGGAGYSQTNNAITTLIAVFEQCTFANNSGDGITFGGGGGGATGAGYVFIKNCIFYGNGGYGVNCPITSLTALAHDNAFGSNTGGARRNFLIGTGDVSLTANPFNNSAGGDYNLNNTAGGGAACRSAGYQWGA